MDCVQFLLEHCGVPHNTKDRWGNTPFDEAETFGHDKIAAYLQTFDDKVQDVSNKTSSPDVSPTFMLGKDVRSND